MKVTHQRPIFHGPRGKGDVRARCATMYPQYSQKKLQDVIRKRRGDQQFTKNSPQPRPTQAPGIAIQRWYDSGPDPKPDTKEIKQRNKSQSKRQPDQAYPWFRATGEPAVVQAELEERKPPHQTLQLGIATTRK